MARATHVMKARKDVPGTDIKAGESYYWWKFRRGGKHYSRTPPKGSQLTQSNYLSQLLAIQERIADLDANDGLKSEVDDIVSDLRSLAEECEGNRDNMPESLQDSETGQLLETRADQCNSAADELEQIELDEFQPDEDGEWSKCGDCDGTGKAEGDGGDDGEAKCPTCDGTGKDEHAEPQNDDQETEPEYWQGKLDEIQGVSIDVE